MISGKTIVLCGYNWAGCKALELLTHAGAIVHVFTHEAESHIPDLFEYASHLGVPVTVARPTPESMPVDADLICSIYFRHKIMIESIRRCKRGGINLHPSLLPKYKGCSSLTWAMVNGERNAGFTYHYLTENFDEGRILLQRAFPIESFDTQLNLYQRAMFMAMDHLMIAVELALLGVDGTSQEGDSSYYRRGAPFDGLIDPGWDEERVRRFIRAMKNPPYSPAKLGGQDVYRYSDIHQNA